MTTKASCEEGESDSKDRPPQQTSLDTAKPPQPMSAAVASDLNPQPGNSSPHPSSGTLVMNPLVQSALPRRASLHALTDAEPSLKKRKISDGAASTPPAVVPTTTAAAAPITEAKEAKSVSQNNSSCDSIQSKTLSKSQNSSSARIARVENAKKDSPQPTGQPLESISRAPVLPGEGEAPPPTPQATTENATTAADATTTTTAAASTSTTSLKPSATETAATPAAATATTTSTADTVPAASPGAAAAPEKPPLKSTKMSHLRQKYTGELEYMLREFEKLERQLLGARKTEESAASRERREKLHSFILHLTETIQQIEKGCELEAAGKSTLPATQQTNAQDAALANPSQDKEEEENVQKLEEHILANLLPVKVRLKKQLAAQQGAKHNPATMPHRGGHGVPVATPAGSTFADAARRQQEAAKAQQESAVAPAAPVAPDQTQFGKPLVKGSNLTKKLHGPTLGSSQRAHGDGVGAPETAASTEKKKYYGGLAVGSAQMESSFDAASNVHKVVIQDPALVAQSLAIKEDPKSEAAVKDALHKASVEEAAKPAALVQFPNGVAGGNAMSEERRRKLRRKKRKKKRLREQAKAAAAEQREQEKGRKQKAAKKSHRGPRHVEYMCALCNEVYNSTCDYNPWWALTQHDCPKCRKRQVPRIDIGAPANAIEYHPALLAHADDNGGVAPAERCSVADVSEVTPSTGASNVDMSDDDSFGGSDVSSDCVDISTDEDADSLDSDSDEFESLSPADRAEQERFGMDYGGPTLEEREASRLLILMAHASTCPCQHKSKDHRDTCRSVKWMMLHVRDCPGTTANYDVCPFPWCRKVKHLLYHLVSCQEPTKCKICAPADIGRNLQYLRTLNDHRALSYRQKLLAKFSSPPAVSARPSSVNATHETPAANPVSGSSQEDTRSAVESPKDPRPVQQHPGASTHSDLVDSVRKEPKPHSAMPCVPLIKVEDEIQTVKQEPDSSTLHDAAVIKTEPVAEDSPVLASTAKPTSGPSHSSQEPQEGKGPSGEVENIKNDRQQDAENNKGEAGQSSCASTPEKPEEPTKVPEDADCAALVEKTGENTSELLQVK